MYKRILIIEDNVAINEMYAMKFRNEGFLVETAFEGLEGLTKIQSFKPDVILLDIMMPGMNGYETLNIIKTQSSYNVKIIMFSNLNNKADIDKALEMGADEYLLKANTTPKQAVEKVNQLLDTNPPVPSEENIFLHPGINKFKVKRPNGGNDIDIEIDINIKY